ncbi:o-succinylbenzoate--CoA ligase [Myxococcota bacterium]|nr:o-succinylbenzoate--CoA ligase [Myxococcota bacterium]
MKAWILERAARTPDAIALASGDGTLRYAELAARAQALAATLRDAGIVPGDRVAAVLGNNPALVELFHATALTGAILVPLSPRLSPPDLARHLRDASPKGLTTGSGWKLTGPPDTVSGRAVDEPRPARDGGPFELEAAAAIVYTSGTSGEPKGVVLSYRNLLASAVGAAFHLGALPTDRWLACLPLGHIGGLAILARSVLAGSAVVLHERFDPIAVSRAIDRDGITIASFVPAMLAQVLEVRGTTQPPATLRAVLLGGAPAPAPLLERAAKARWPLLPTYGLTEACSQVATLPVGAPLRTDGGGLRPLPGVELRIADDDERVRQPGTTGEIHVRGATVTPGYWQRPEASRQRLAGGWLRTGDLGVLDADGALRVVGRADDCIITGGENVHPAEVETVLLAHPDVADVGVAGLADPVYGERVAAWVVRHPGSPVDAATLERFARTQLTHYKVPRSWQFVPALPRNAGGKLQRRKLGDETPAT